MTDRVKAGCAAAVARALENRRDPAVLEVTLDLGKLHGTWAEVYRRREELTAGHVEQVAAAWRKLVQRLDVDDLVKQWKRHASLPAPMESAGQDWRKAAVAAVLLWLRSVLADPDYRELALAVTAALTAGQAEGRTGALAVAADQAGAVGFDWDKASEAMAREVAVHLPDAAEPWVQRIIAGAAADGGKLLADLADEGESDAAIAKAVTDVIAGPDAKALKLIVDYACGAAMSRGSLDLYQSEGLALVAWLTAGDGRVCFPAGTPVMTPDGERPIETLRTGDLVLTPKGELPVHCTGGRPYAGGLTVLMTERGTVAATNDHPFWTPCGWREIGQIEPGDVVHTAQDERAEVRRVIHLDFAKPDDLPAGARKLRVTRDIALSGDPVPVITVSLDGDTVPHDGEVDRPLADGVFLLELDSEAFQGHPDAGFQPRLAAETAVAGDGAELRVGQGRDHPELLAAIPAVEDHGRSAAFLGAVMSVEMLLGSESLAAALAVNVNGVSGLAGDRADVVTVGNRSLSDGEVFAADGAVLGDRVGPVGVVALPAAERSVRVTTALGAEGLAAGGALPVGVADGRSVIAGVGAEGPRLGDSRVTHELLSAVSAFIAERHFGGCSTLYVTGIDSVPVYDIEVELAHVFYAAGFLVHNCGECQDNEDNGPYAPEDFPSCPDHYRCRCCPTPAEPLPVSAYAAFLVPAA